MLSSPNLAADARDLISIYPSIIASRRDSLHQPHRADAGAARTSPGTARLADPIIEC